MNLLETDPMHGQIALAGFYELRLSKVIAAAAREGGFLVDVGANAGYFSLIWASLNPTNRVLAVEAAPRNLELLKKNVAANGFLPRVQVQGLAAGKQKGELTFLLGPSEQTGWGGLAPSGKTGEGSIKVEVDTLDALVPENQVVDFLKIDVEGADTWVLQGCERLFREKAVRQIHFEQNKPRLRELGIGDTDAVEFLADHGYVSRSLSQTDGEIVDWVSTPG